MSRQTILYVDAICGAGKTYGAISYAIDAAYQDDVHIAIIQPSRELIQQTHTAIRTRMSQQGTVVPVKAIYSHLGYTDDVEETVNGQIERHLRDAATNPTGQILLITHAAFLSLPHWFGKESWEIIIDEVPNIAPTHPYKLEEDSDRLKDIATAVLDDDNLEYYEVFERNYRLALKAVSLKNDVYNVFRDLAHNLLNPSVDVYCHRGQWDKLSTAGNHTIDFFGVVRPALVMGFKKVTIMGAHFNDSLLAMVWGKNDIRFLPNTAIKLRHTIHDIGSRRLDVWYLSEPNWSKELRNRIGCTETSIGPVLPYIKDLLGQEPFIWCANNDLQDRAVAPHFKGNATRISNVCHGINQHDDIHKVMVLSALNLKNDHYKILERKFLIDPIEVKRASSHETIYQAVMRCSLRDPNATAPVTVIVPDRSLGEWLVSQFKDNGNIRLRRVPTGIRQLETDPVSQSLMGGRPPINQVAMTAKERELASRERKNQLREGIMALLFKTGGVDETSSLRSSVYPELELSVIASRQSDPIPFVVEDNESLIDQLRQCWSYSANSKHDNILISPAKFVACDGADTKRGLANVVSVNGIWLDQDEGTLTPQEMQKIFPNYRFISMNSYSGNTRYFFPTTTPMTLDAYHAIWDVMVHAIETYGYSRNKNLSNFHGLDASKRPGCSMFYLPCQAKDKTKSFWVEFDGSYIDPSAWVENYTLPDPTEYTTEPGFKNPQSAAMKKLQESIINRQGTGGGEFLLKQQTQTAIERWRSAAAGTGSREFFILATRLHSLGYDDNDIRSMLTTEAAYGRSPSERRAEISGIMKKIMKGNSKHPAPANDAGHNLHHASDRLRHVIGIQRGGRH